MGIPFQGMALPSNPKFPLGVHLADVARRYCLGLKIISFLVFRIETMDDLLHQCITAMIMRIYGSLVMQQINGGHLVIMQRVLDGDFFAWGLMLHAKMMGQINRC